MILICYYDKTFYDDTNVDKIVENLLNFKFIFFYEIYKNNNIWECVYLMKGNQGLEETEEKQTDSERER